MRTSWSIYVSIAKLIKQKKGLSEIKDKLNEIKQEDKIREIKVKRNEQSLHEIWNYVKRPNLHLISVPKIDGDWNQVGKHSSEYYQGELSQPSKAGQHSNSGNTETTTGILLEKSNSKTHNCQIQRVEMKEKMQRATREKGQVTHRKKSIRLSGSFSRDPTSQKRMRANIWHP